MSNPTMNIRIGTLVPGNKNTPEYIRQIKPHGFESFSITFWQKIGDVNLKNLALEVKEAIGSDDIAINCIGIFGNPLESTPIDAETVRGWEALIDNAHLFGAKVIAGFAGRLRDKKIDESMARYKEIFTPLAKRAEDRGVRIAFENCDMGGDWNLGDWNIAHSPTAWEMMFNEVPSDSIGLEWEPCHQMVSLIDPLPQLRKWINKVYHVHGKDATVLWDVVKTSGIRGGKQYVYHRTPGFGDTNWTDVISILRMGGYTGSIDIEGWHDPVYRDELEMTGQVHGLRYLQQCRGGSHVPNPKVG
jgi:sugar phosphate isomerase/epimerase